ncbi:universal stress protein [Streptacidiphilus sp. N1-12]|uniref:Universal stress protein n=2 Tax=Streptacidiphilus alkalitolerans TaxID=3342712 RepID=A0ABV6WD83_9ACTN
MPTAPPSPSSTPAPHPFTTAPPGIVVGVDGSDGSLWALDRAFTEAAALSLPLHVLSAVNPSPAGFAPGVAELAEESAERLLRGMCEVTERAIAGVAPRHPGAPMPALFALLGNPIDTLLEASARHHTLVVGARGNGGFRRLLLGSVASALVHHAACPVLLVPARNTPIEAPVDIT